MYHQLDRATKTLAQTMAILGGLVLLLTIATTCASILGRTFSFVGLNQIPGDFEVVELGIGFAVFAFLPLAQYSRAHARVDLFAASFPVIFNKVLDLIADLLLLGVAGFLSWRLWLGMLDKKAYVETTFILQVPIWYAYLAAVVSMIAFTGVALFCVLRSTRELGARP